jgi:predicted amidophosphoribosyltransferase
MQPRGTMRAGMGMRELLPAARGCGVEWRGRVFGLLHGSKSIFIEMFTSLLRTLPELLPSSCGVCHAWGAQTVCEACLAAFAQPRWRCSTCALPLHSAGTMPVKRCGACLSLGSQLDACHAAVDYVYPWDKLLQRLKYSNGGDLRAQPALAGSVALVMRCVAEQDTALAKALHQASRSDWIIPVALHPERQQGRGFNQASSIAHALFPGHPRIRQDLLVRIKNTAVQADLPRDARLHNLRSAFISAPLQASLLKGSEVTLVDDVTTTTATLGAAAQALRLAGVRVVNALVFARAV